MHTSNARTLRKTLLSFIAAGTLAVPLLASAALSPDADRSLLNAQPQQSPTTNPAQVYARLQDQSRDVCGSDKVRMTGDLRRAAQNDQCYEGTLNAAVARLDDPAVSQLHHN